MKYVIILFTLSFFTANTGFSQTVESSIAKNIIIAQSTITLDNDEDETDLEVVFMLEKQSTLYVEMDYTGDPYWIQKVKDLVDVDAKEFKYLLIERDKKIRFTVARPSTLTFSDDGLIDALIDAVKNLEEAGATIDKTFLSSKE